MREEIHRKLQKVTQEREGAGNKMMPLTQNFSVTIFAANQFLTLCNPWGSDNATVGNNKKTHKRRYLCAGIAMLADTKHCILSTILPTDC